MPRSRRHRLGEILVEWGVVTASAVEEALTHARAEGLRIGEALIALGLADEEDVTKALASQYDMEYIDLDKNVVVPTEMHLIPDDLIHKHLVLPLAMEDGRLKVIVTDPLDLETLDMLRFRLNCDLDPCLASKTRTRNFIEQYVRTDQSIDEAFRGLDFDEDETAVASQTDDEYDQDSAPIIRLVTMIITEAVKGRSSDIHIEPMANRVRVRYRLDGVCIERDNIPKRMQGSVINRFKIMAGIDLAEKRLPQDGRIKMLVGGSNIDFRVSVLPSYHGESVVLRILRPETVRRLRGRFPTVALHNFFGLTETISMTHVLPSVDALSHADSVGKLLPEVYARIVAEEKGVAAKMSDAPPDEVGELCFHRSNVIRAYWGKPGLLDESFFTDESGDWFRTGDRASRDGQGYFRIRGRSKDMIITAGENVYAMEVEAVLARHPGVEDGAVVGVPATGVRTSLGELVKAVIVPAEGKGPTAAEIKRFGFEHLTSYKVPQIVEFVRELPRNAAGKVLKSELVRPERPDNGCSPP